MKTEKLLKRLFQWPTAPFRENWVLAEISNILTESNIPYFQDASGNIIAGVKKASDFGRAPRLALQAHTDHPGFHLHSQVNKSTWQALWYGGAPFALMKEAPMWIYSPRDPTRVTRAICRKVGKAVNSRAGTPIELRLDRIERDLDKNCFGSFGFSGFRKTKQLIFTRAADDLAGVAVALAALIDQGPRGTAIGLFTRAEEVGFVGAWQMIKDKVLPMQTLIICIESSRELPLAELGQGPVLRIGDRSSIYDSDLSIWMWQKAQELALHNKKFKFQRRLMDGGSCEATAFALNGYQSSGLAIPLRNYHNQGSAQPEPEIIHLKDVEQACQLATHLAREFEGLPPRRKLLGREIERSYRGLRPKLYQQVQFSLASTKA